MIWMFTVTATLPVPTYDIARHDDSGYNLLIMSLMTYDYLLYR
jgi:hypothetical protein